MLVKPLVRPIVRAIAGNPTASLGSGFSPTSLFLDGSKGVVYDNNDLSSFYLDSALTTPATVNGLVGGQLDKSGNGFHRTQATTGSKPVLRGTPVGSNIVTNGDFATDTVWTKGTGWSIGSGVATKTAGTDSSLFQAITPAVGGVYRITYTLTVTAGAFQPCLLGGTSVFGALRTASGTYVEYLTAATGNNSVGITTNATAAGTVDNIEVVDVSAGQVTAPYGLQYDGVDDFLQTAAVDFSATDKMFVCAGVRKLSDASVGLLVELSENATTNAGTFFISAPRRDALVNDYAFDSSGTVRVALFTGVAYVAPITNVLSGISSISGPNIVLRVNGLQVAQSTDSQGTGNFGNYALYFGRRGGASFPLNGLDFGFVICGKTLTSTQISSTERYIAQRTGIAL